MFNYNCNNLVIKNSDNENSQLNASGYYLENGSKYAYVGGLVGRGPCVENCTNYVDINYTGGGDFTGGVMEYFELGAAITGSGITSSEASASFKKLKNLSEEEKENLNEYLNRLTVALHNKFKEENPEKYEKLIRNRKEIFEKYFKEDNPNEEW